MLHGHGAKGAALARLTLSAPRAIRVYTPHGGSLATSPPCSVHNGVGEAEFAPIVPRPDATDIICLGELRPVKAFDVLIERSTSSNNGAG